MLSLWAKKVREDRIKQGRLFVSPTGTDEATELEVLRDRSWFLQNGTRDRQSSSEETSPPKDSKVADTLAQSTPDHDKGDKRFSWTSRDDAPRAIELIMQHAKFERQTKEKHRLDHGACAVSVSESLDEPLVLDESDLEQVEEDTFEGSCQVLNVQHPGSSPPILNTESQTLVPLYSDGTNVDILSYLPHSYANLRWTADSWLNLHEPPIALAHPSRTHPLVVDHAIVKKGSQAELFFLYPYEGKPTCMKIFYLSHAIDLELSLYRTMTQKATRKRMTMDFVPKLILPTKSYRMTLTRALLRDLEHTGTIFYKEFQKMCHDFNMKPFAMMMHILDKCALIYDHGGDDLFVTSMLCKPRKVQLLHYARGLVQCVRKLHACGVVHCDLKVENTIVDGNKRIRLIDVGSSHLISRDRPNVLDQGCGTRGMMPYALTLMMSQAIPLYEIQMDQMLDIYPMLHTIADILRIGYDRIRTKYLQLVPTHRYPKTTAYRFPRYSQPFLTEFFKLANIANLMVCTPARVPHDHPYLSKGVRRWLTSDYLLKAIDYELQLELARADSHGDECWLLRDLYKAEMKHHQHDDVMRNLEKDIERFCQPMREKLAQQQAERYVDPEEFPPLDLDEDFPPIGN